MSELEPKKNYIMTFIKENINKRKFNKDKICKDKKYEDIMKNTTDIINNLDEEEIEFHIMLIKYIKDNKIALVDPEYFIESKLDYFLYDEDVLKLVNKE
jgi:hypothetical protein